jgi:hypothetical protein
MTEAILKEKIKDIIELNHNKILKMLKSVLNLNEINFSEIKENEKYLIEFFSIVYHLLSFKYKSSISKNDFNDYCILNKNYYF